MHRHWHIALVAVVILLAGCTGGTPGATVDTESPVSPSPTASATAQSQAPSPEGTMEIHFINVGQSASTLIIGPTGETMLIDTGDFRTDGEHVLAYLKANDIERVDHLVVTHNDADHIGGNAAVIEYLETEGEGVGAVYDPGIAASTQTYEAYLDAVEEYDVTLYEVREGDQLPFEGVETRVLGPPDPYLDVDGRNENGIVLHLTFGQTSFLHTGDAEERQEEYLVDEYGASLNATVYKAGHHGSDSSSSSELLDLVSPKVTVISSAYDSQYGHPHEVVLERFAERSIPAYWTATHGTVVLESNGSAVTVKTQARAPTNPLELREGDPIEPGTTTPVEDRAVIAAADGGVQTVTPGTTPTATPMATATDGGTDSGALVLAEVHADAEGDDRENLNDEYVVFENTGDSTLDLSGWTVADSADHVYTVPEGTTLAPGAQITLHTGSGSDTDTDLYWGASAPVWNNGGDTVTVRTEDETIVLQEEYT
ncbi:lamin tail domain-containing protein [Halobaculum roseum]|uniref:Lamin tail domain-containing protein n=1 Tax=Halobaculum roseum TaxID=2175149 RepID=A0ABD5MMW0_9EURY|nr:lamin tail domain-containing protein [Halobaculum roseum]QZY01907.1 lamin tail domain-containing protein [Halobaculum roseum]